MVTYQPVSSTALLPSWWDQIDASCAAAVVTPSASTARPERAFLMKSSCGVGSPRLQTNPFECRCCANETGFLGAAKKRIAHRSGQRSKGSPYWTFASGLDVTQGMVASLLAAVG